MVEDASVDHVPVLTGGSGKAELREFYATHFIRECRPTWRWSRFSGLSPRSRPGTLSRADYRVRP
jgi:hypothetical protein